VGAGAVPGHVVVDGRAGIMPELKPAGEKRIAGGQYPIGMGGVMRRQLQVVGRDQGCESADL
jgi:hypothetical protein